MSLGKKSRGAKLLKTPFRDGFHSNNA